jgi:phage RecT family recombinase
MEQNEKKELEVNNQQKNEQSEQSTKKDYSPQMCANTIMRLPQQLKEIRNCFAEPFSSFRKCYKDPDEADRVMAKEIDFAAQAMLSNTYLITIAKRNPQSLVNALKNVALIGSTLNPVLKQCYLVPFKDNIVCMPSYMGLVDLLINNGLVKKIESHPVFEGEKFEILYGSGGYLKHIPNPWGKRDKDNLLGVYALAVMTDGTELYDTLSKEEVDTIKSKSPAGKSDKTTPWDTDYIEMARKSAVRRIFKMIPKRGISEDKIKSISVAFDYDEKVEQSWYKEQSKQKKDNFDEDEIEYTEVVDE